MTTLTDRVAIVTGGSRGIGRAIALEFARLGAAVIVNYNASGGAAEEVVAEITSKGGQAMAVQADVGQMAQAEALIKTAIDTYGKLDILVNNAGVARDGMIMMMKEDDWDTVIDTNLKSAFACSKPAVRAMMRKRYGRVINISSIVGLVGQGGQTNYAASKAGLIGFTRALAKEVGSRQITVNAIAPGYITTAMTANLPANLMEELQKRIVIERYGTPEDIAYAAAFLASEQAGYITGQVLTVDGGLAIG